MIYKGWPTTGGIVIGLFIAIELICNGWYWIMVGMGLKKLSDA